MLGCKNLKLFAISLPLQCRDLCLYREVSTSTILPNFTGKCRDSVVFAFDKGISKRERKRKRMLRKYTSGKFWVASIWFSWPTRIILASLDGSRDFHKTHIIDRHAPPIDLTLADTAVNSRLSFSHYKYKICLYQRCKPFLYTFLAQK